VGIFAVFVILFDVFKTEEKYIGILLYLSSSITNKNEPNKRSARKEGVNTGLAIRNLG